MPKERKLANSAKFLTFTRMQASQRDISSLVYDEYSDEAKRQVQQHGSFEEGYDQQLGTPSTSETLFTEGIQNRRWFSPNPLPGVSAETARA